MSMNSVSFLSISLALLLSVFLPTIASANVSSEKPVLEGKHDQTCRDNICTETKPTQIIMSSVTYFPPPLKQISEGISPSNVTCTEGKTLVLKQSNGLPACLNSSSVAKLILRGWAIHILPDYNDKGNNSGIFALGEFMTESEIVTYFEDTTGYLAKPVIDGNYPGIVMIHEWWGLNDNIKEMADKLASHGYVVLAVDLYNGKVATTSDQARQLIAAYDPERGIQNMNSATSFLNENYASKNIGSIGWCFGGSQSLNLALSNNDMDATVIYYGSLVTDTETLSSINWPILGIFAELDKGITPDSVNAFKSSLDDIGIKNDITIYPGVDHAFANPSGDRYAPNESRDAWSKTVRFFESTLK